MSYQYYVMDFTEILWLSVVFGLWILSAVCCYKRCKKITTIERAEVMLRDKSTKLNESTSNTNNNININNNTNNSNSNSNNNIIKKLSNASLINEYEHGGSMNIPRKVHSINETVIASHQKQQALLINNTNNHYQKMKVFKSKHISSKYNHHHHQHRIVIK